MMDQHLCDRNISENGPARMRHPTGRDMACGDTILDFAGESGGRGVVRLKFEIDDVTSIILLYDDSSYDVTPVG